MRETGQLLECDGGVGKKGSCTHRPPNGTRHLELEGYYGAMSDGKHCPGCTKDIGIWPVLMAGLPSWVKCPHCQARLSYGGGGFIVAGLFGLLLLLTAGAFFFARQHYTANALRFYVLLAVVVIALWLPVELMATLCLRKWGKLEKLL